MKSCVARRWLFAGMGLGVACAWVAAAPTRTKAAPAGSRLAAEEEAACSNNLHVIYKAIEAYRADHKDLPNWLSDLVPRYLSDANVLVCPVCRRTGQTESPPLADPKIPTSYLFEFCPVPLGGAATNAPDRTRRDWKRRQMGLVGSVVPIVRCRHHEPVLNLAFDGRIYESPPMWELTVTNQVSLAELSPGRLFANEPEAASKTSRGPAARRFLSRDLKARKELLDLSTFYNAMLTESWHGRTGNDLATLPRGIQTLGGVEFDVRGIVQLGSKSESAIRYPTQVQGIQVRQKCQRLHFLHASGFGSAADDGKRVGTFIVHFARNNMRLEIPVVYGRDVLNWHARAGEPPPGKPLQVAWTGENAVSKQAGGSIRLFLTTWTNLVPAVEIESLDYVSGLGMAAPFLVAVTVE